MLRIQVVPTLVIPDGTSPDAVRVLQTRIAGHQGRAATLAQANRVAIHWASPRLLPVSGPLPVLQGRRWNWLSPAYWYYARRRVRTPGLITMFHQEDAPNCGMGTGWCVVDPGTPAVCVVHALGHVLGLSHVADPENIMYPSLSGQQGYFTPAQYRAMAVSPWSTRVRSAAFP